MFDGNAIPRTDSKYRSYQLLRNVLAAHALGCNFCVLRDARRPDLREELRMGKLEAFAREHSSEEKDRRVEVLIRLTDELENKRREYK